MSSNFYKIGFYVSSILCIFMLIVGLCIWGEVQRFERKLKAAEEILTSYKQALEITHNRYERLAMAIKCTLGEKTLKGLLDIINKYSE